MLFILRGFISMSEKYYLSIFEVSVAILKIFFEKKEWENNIDPYT